MSDLRRSLCILLLAAAVSTFSPNPGVHQQRANQKSTMSKSQVQHLLWTNPGDPATKDLRYGAGGIKRQPQPPFRFIEEDKTGTSPKVKVMDARNVMWDVKWGEEARPSVFSSGLVWAVGYYVEPEYFLAQGRIDGAHDLK